MSRSTMRKRARRAEERRVYNWSRPGQYPVEAQVVGEFIERLPDKTPEAFVRAAEDPTSAAHQLFEWDEAEAAHKHRLTQARVIYGSLQIDVVVYRNRKAETHRVSAVVRTSGGGEYDGIVDAMTEPAKRDFVLAQAISQLNRLKRRYRTLSELAVVFSAIDKVARKHA